MAQFEPSDGIRIGEVLKATRTRQALDIRTIEERTKIRTKYLRALENEEWEVLPNHAYAKGFLRTYAQALGLDGDALVDEYRRQVESAGQEPYSVGEPVLEHRRPLGEPPAVPPVLAWVGIGVVVLIAVLLAVGLLGGGDGDDERAERREARAEKRAEQRREASREQRQQEALQAAEETIQLRLVMESDVAVCLLGDGARPLIDGQVLLAGNEESFEARQFELRFPSGFDVGQFELFLNGDRRRLAETLGPSAYTITPPDRVRPAPEPGQECP